VSSSLTPERRAFIEQACARLVLEAAAANDRQDFAAFARCFAEDGSLSRPGAAPLRGRAAIAASYASRPKTRITRHVCSNILIEVESATAARGITYVVLYAGDGAAAPDGHFGVAAEARRLVGEFADRFIATRDGWRIAERSARFVLHT
jgi:hypothetical protein